MGIILFAIGFIEDIQAWDPTKGAMFWALGTIVSIPGFFFVYKLIRAYCTDDPRERENILRDIPEL